MTSSRQLEVQTDDQTPHKWNTPLGEDVYQRFFSKGSPVVHKVFGDGSLFSPFLFGKFFDPSDVFPLWEFESDVLLSNLQSSSKSTVSWFQTDQAYVLKAELPEGVGKNNNSVQVYVENGKVVEISGEWKPQKESSKSNTTKKDWRHGRWWENGYVRKLETPEDADLSTTEAYVSDDGILELRIPKKASISIEQG